MNDPTFRMINITKVLVQVPGSKAVIFNGHIPNKDDYFQLSDKTYIVESRIFDTEKRSVTIILKEVCDI